MFRLLILFLSITVETSNNSRSERAEPENRGLGPLKMLAIESTESSIFLKWKPPEIINVTLVYKISYLTQRKNFLFCTTKYIPEKSVISNVTQHTFTHLKPFSKYRMLIHAEDVDNSKLRSEITSLVVVTKGYKNLQDAELSGVTIYLKKFLWKTVTFGIKSFDCSKVRGELKVNITIVCEDKASCPKEYVTDLTSLTFSFDSKWKPLIYHKYYAMLCRLKKCKLIGVDYFKPSSTDLDAPANLKVKWYKNSTIELFWIFPKKLEENYSFGITIQKRHMQFNTSHYIVHSGNVNISTYNFKVPEIFPATIFIDIQVDAKISSYKSPLATIETSSYPPVPNWIEFNNLQLEIGRTMATVTVSVTKRREDMSLSSRFLFILMKDDETNTTEMTHLKKLEEDLDITLNKQTRVVAKIELSRHDNEQLIYSIGNETFNQMYFKIKNLKYKDISNRPLKRNRNYIVTMLLVSEFHKKYRAKEHFFHFSTKNLDEKKGKDAYVIPVYTMLYVLLILFIFVVLMVGGVMAYRRKRQRSSISMNRNLYVNQRGSFSSNQIEEASGEQRSDIGNSANASSNGPVYSEEVSVANFEKYVKMAILSAELERQYNLLSPDELDHSDLTSSMINGSNNIYLDLVAYDRTRVTINRVPGEKQCPYINASYIDGYKTSKAFIATQNPKKEYFNTFWRMVWEENVQHIFMLSNIHGEYKDKVEQFWPNINEEMIFRDISVKNLHTTVSADFETRTFKLTRYDEVREINLSNNYQLYVEQIEIYQEILYDRNETSKYKMSKKKVLRFQSIIPYNVEVTNNWFRLKHFFEKRVEKILFTGWPSNDVPIYPQSLIPFVRELLKVPLSPSAPVVVQCSNGVGKTGTILLIDISLRMAAEKVVVDILSNFQKLRKQKASMLDNVEQYKLSHLVVLQLLTGLRTSISCSQMNEMAVKIIDQEEYRIQMDYLRRIEWQNQAMECSQVYTEIFVNYPEKNRIQNIYPGDFGRVFLEKYPKLDDSSSYINAVQVDGYKCRGRYIVTQHPMPNTLGDFWRLVAEKGINVIVSLNEVDIKDETCCEFLPTIDDSIIRPVDYILVYFKEVVTMQNYNIHYLQVENRLKKEKMDVEVLVFKQWPAKKALPLSGEEFLSFWEEADTMSKRSKHILVTCFDGATASGVFVAMSFIIEKMKVEQKCDVCQAVQTVRHNRKQFVSEESQFVFLFVTAIRFINGFQFYSNFQEQ